MLDLKKAFQTVNHELLIRKFDTFDLSGRTKILLESCLVNRMQNVEYEGKISGDLKNDICVPQGAIIGPVWFKMMINDLTDPNLNSELILYADDISLLFQKYS